MRRPSFFLVCLVLIIIFAQIPSVSASPTIIFSDGFESGNFSAWTGSYAATGLSISVISTSPHHGAYHTRTWASGTPGANAIVYCYKTFTGVTTIFVRYYIRFQNTPTSGKTWDLMQIYNTTMDSSHANLWYENNAGTLRWRMRYRNGGAWYESYYNHVVSVGQWYCIEMKLVVSSTVGEQRFYLNNSEVITATNLNNTDRGSAVNGVTMPYFYCDDTNFDIYFDCVVVADTYIGPEIFGAEYDYVTRTSNVDGVADKGTHGNFTAEQYGPDSIFDTLTEANTAPSTTTELWVNGFTSQETAWTLTGTSPYLNAIDNPTNIISTATAAAAVSRFNFTDLGSALEIVSVQLCVYAKTAGNDGASIYLYNSTSSYLIANQYFSASYAWWNYTVTPTLPTLTEINGAQLRFVYYYTGTKSTTTIDAALLSVTHLTSFNYELDLEAQWINANYTRTNEELCIKTGTLGSENLMVDWWNATSSSWLTIISTLSANTWNNVSITSYLTSTTFTIRYKGTTESGDTNQDSWQVDCALLHTWEAAGNFYNFYGSINAQFTVSKIKSCAFNRYFSLNQIMTIILGRAYQFNKYSLLSPQFALNSQRNWIFERFNIINPRFTINYQKSLSFSVFSILNPTFSISGFAEFIVTQILNIFGSISQTISVVFQRNLMFNKLGEINPLFTVDSKRNWIFEKFLSINSQLAIDFQKVISFTKFSSITESISIESLRNLMFSRFGFLNPQFTVNYQRAMSFTVFSTLNPTFSISSLVEFISAQILNLFGSIGQALSITLQRTWAFDRTSSISSQLSIGLMRQYALSKFSSIIELVSVESQRNWILEKFSTLNSQFMVNFQKAIAFTISSTINPSFSITGFAEFIYEKILNFFGSIGQIVSVSLQKSAIFSRFMVVNQKIGVEYAKAFSFNILSSINSAFSITHELITARFLNIIGEISQTISIAIQKTISFSLFPTINPQFVVSGTFELLAKILNFFGTIGAMMGIQGWTSLPVPMAAVTRMWVVWFLFGGVGFVFGVFALMYMKNRRDKEEKGEELYIYEEEEYIEEG